MKDCFQYREHLELLPSLDSPDPFFEPLVTHLKECSDCLENYLLSQRVDGYIKQSIDDISVPPFLAQKIKINCQSKPKLYQHILKWSYVAVPLVLLSLFYIFIWLPENGSGQQLDSLVTYVLDHHKAISNKKNERYPIVEEKNIQRFLATSNEPFEKITDELNNEIWHRCNLGDIQANYVCFEKDGKDASLYLVTDDLLNLKQWTGKKRYFKQGNYSVAIWKKGDIIYSMVLKYPQE